MERLYLTRHGETEWNLDGNRYCGITDIGLSDIGKLQATRLAVRLKSEKIENIIASSMLRSRQTAEIIGKMLGIPTLIQPEFREINFGAWEGKKPDELSREPDSLFLRWLSDPEHVLIPHGESIVLAQQRVLAAYDQLQQVPGRVLLVGHNTINRLLLTSLLEMPLRLYRRISQSNGGLSILRYDRGVLQVETLNEHSFQNHA
jgi:broad specificity phosphatase PhoE